jgi:hypothetical protein
MTNPTITRPRSTNPYPTTVGPLDGARQADAGASVVTIGTFAAGQSGGGRYVAAAEAPQGSFASGQARLVTSRGH